MKNNSTWVRSETYSSQMEASVVAGGARCVVRAEEVLAGVQCANGAVMVANADCETIFAVLQTAKTKRWMVGVMPPQPIILDSQFLDAYGERVE